MAELLAGEVAAKGGKGTAAAPKKAGKSKGKRDEGAAAGPPLPSPPPPPPPVAASDVPVLSKARTNGSRLRRLLRARLQLRPDLRLPARRRRRLLIRHRTSQSRSARGFPPLDLSADGEFQRSMNLPPRPGIEAEIDKIVAECEARLAAQAAVAAAALHETRDPAVEKEGAHTSGGAGAAAAKPSAVPLSFAAPRLEAAPASIPLVASLLAGAAAVGVGAVG